MILIGTQSTDTIRKMVRLILSKSFDESKVFLSNRKLHLKENWQKLQRNLRKRYPETKKFSGTLSKLKSDNSDLSLSSINTWTMQVYNLSAQDYLTQQGIMEAPKSVEDACCRY